MKRAISETKRRREIQQKYNKDHNITPRTVKSEITDGLRAIIPKKEESKKINLKKIPKDQWQNIIVDLTNQMHLASSQLKFEEAAELRDQITEIKKKLL